MRWLDRLLLVKSLASRVRKVQGMPNDESRGRAWEQLLQDLNPGERIVWVHEFPRELGHECAKMREVINSCAPGDGMPVTQLATMTHCYWCGVKLEREA